MALEVWLKLLIYLVSQVNSTYTASYRKALPRFGGVGAAAGGDAGGEAPVGGGGGARLFLRSGLVRVPFAGSSSLMAASVLTPVLLVTVS